MNQRGEGNVVVVLVILVFAGLIAWASARASSGNKEALKAANEFSQNIPGTTKVTCVKRDTDSDGYLGCTVFRGEKDPIFIECAGSFTTNEGCRAPKVGQR